MFKYRSMFYVAVISLMVLSLAVAQEAPAAGDRAGGMGGMGGAAGRGGVGRGMMMGGGRGTVRSPEILSDNKVTFRLSAPQANSVSVSGDWGTIPASAIPDANASTAAPATGRGMSGVGGGGTTMTKDENGIWSVTVGPLNSELYGYTFNVDGARVWDPANMQLKRDGTRIESVLIVPGKRGDLYSVKDVPQGTLAKVWYDSPTLNLKRRLYVYTPPGYETSGEKYPVLYLLHGAGGDEDAWTSLGRTPQILDNLIAAGKCKPMLVVMTNGNANQTAAPDVVSAPAGAAARGGRGGGAGSIGGGAFPDSLAKDVVPFIEKSYRVIANKQNRAVAGLSMGGGHTITVSNANPDMFDYIGVMSMGNNNADQFNALAAAKPKLYWVGCGQSDSLVTSARQLVEILKSKDFNYKYFESTGGHTWYNWRIYLTELAPLLFK